MSTILCALLLAQAGRSGPSISGLGSGAGLVVGIVVAILVVCVVVALIRAGGCRK